MAAALTGDELIKSHIIKEGKYFIHIKDKTLEDELSDDFDWNLIDTIDNPELINEARNASYKLYERTTVASAKKPTILEDGIILSKKLAKKTDKKLFNVGVGFFDYNQLRYACIKLIYERFDIYEIFCLV